MLNITIQPIKPIDHDEVLDFVRLHFYQEEPLTIGYKPKLINKEDEEFTMSNIEYGTCLKAVQNLTVGNKVGKIVGVVMAGPRTAPLATACTDHLKQYDDSKWGKISKFLSFIESEANIFERYGVKKILHAHVLGVHADFRRASIGVKLMKALMALGENLDFQMLTVDCTSAYSAKLCEKLSMECVNCIYYKDYKDENGNQTFKPPLPHDCVKTFAIKLN